MDENTYLQNNKLCRLLPFSKHNLSPQFQGGMNCPSAFQACLMRWRVQKVGGRQFAVSATINRATYDLIGHFKSLEEAQQAGRRYVSDVLGKARQSYELDSVIDWACHSGAEKTQIAEGSSGADAV